MKQLGYIHFRTRKQFRRWLESYHEQSDGIWMIFFRNSSETACITFQEALEEALCFGWIDSVIKKLDDVKYARKFSPRKNTKNWSELNKRTVLQLIEEGRMTESGLKKIDSYNLSGTVDWTEQPVIEIKNRDLNKFKNG